MWRVCVAGMHNLVQSFTGCMSCEHTGTVNCGEKTIIVKAYIQQCLDPIK